jgi:hypothetical protein
MSAALHLDVGQLSAVTEDWRALEFTCTGVTSALTSTVSDRLRPSVSLPRSRIAPASTLNVSTATGEPLQLDLERVLSRPKRRKAEHAGFVGGIGPDDFVATSVKVTTAPGTTPVLSMTVPDTAVAGTLGKRVGREGQAQHRPTRMLL